MKKITLLIFAVFISLITNAQESGNIELGGNIGLNFSNSVITGTGAETGQTDTKTSFNIAASGEYYFSDRWGIKAKLIKDNKGWANDFIQDLDTGEIVEGNYELNYISIPVMANWHFGKKRNWYLNFGLYAAFLTTAEIEGIDISEVFNDSDFGLAYGIGVKIPLNDSTKIFFEYDAQSGLSDIIANSVDGSGSLGVQNGRSSLNIGVLFTL